MNRRDFLAFSTVSVAASALVSRHSAAAPVAFDGNIAWQPWEAGVKQAVAQNKAICLVLYADWCPHCRELAPVWLDKDLEKLAKSVVMVHQNVDERPAWIGQKYGRFGSYVPRIFLLRPDTSIIEEITSGHPRFPYFYTPGHVANLRAALVKAQQLVGPIAHVKGHSRG